MTSYMSIVTFALYTTHRSVTIHNVTDDRRRQSDRKIRHAVL